MNNTRTYALQAAKWAKEKNKYHKDMTNWDCLCRKITTLKSVRYEQTIMRDQVNVGFSNNYWPCLSRIVIMHEPGLASYIHPRSVTELDSPEGALLLAMIYEDITGERCRFTSWKEAK